MQIQRWNPEALSKPDGYSQIVTISGAHRTIHLGGKAGVRRDGSIPTSLEEQVDVIFNNVTIALAEADATPAHVVDIQIFIVDLSAIDPSPVYDAVRSFFPDGHKPTSMVIGVEALAYPALKVEIKFTAAVPEL